MFMVGERSIESGLKTEEGQERRIQQFIITEIGVLHKYPFSYVTFASFLIDIKMEIKHCNGIIELSDLPTRKMT